MNILIIGATGFIGSSLTAALLKKKHKVSRNRKKKKGYLDTYNFKNKSFKYYQVDLLKINSLSFIKEKIDIIINLASMQPKKNLKFNNYYDSNVLISKKILKFFNNKKFRKRKKNIQTF